ADKRRRCFWNGAGRAAGSVAGTTHIAFLGCRIAFEGTVGLPRAKLRAILQDLRARARRAAALAGPAEVCAALARALDPRAPSATAYAPWLRGVVNDRRQLGEIDHELCRAVASAVTGRPAPRAFRELPPRALRALGLPSLVAERNRSRRAEAGGGAGPGGPPRPGAAKARAGAGAAPPPRGAAGAQSSPHAP